MRETWPIGRGRQGGLLSTVLVDLECRAVSPQAWQPEMHAVQARAGDASPALEIFPRIIALRRHRLATEHGYVEIRKASPVESDEVGVPVLRGDWLGHDQNSAADQSQSMRTHSSLPSTQARCPGWMSM